MIRVKHLRLRSVVAAAALACPLVAGAQTAAGAQASPGESGQVRLATRRAVPPNVISVDLGGFVSGELVIQYERALTPSFSVTAAARARLFGGFEVPGINHLIESRRLDFGFGAHIGARVYMNGNAPQGLFFGAGVGGGWHRESPSRAGPYPQFSEEHTHFAVPLSLGYQWIARQGLAISVGVGVTLLWGASAFAYIPLHLSFGYAF